MLSIALFDAHSALRIMQRAGRYFSTGRKCNSLQLSQDTLWLDGFYLKFSPKIVTLNVFNSSMTSREKIRECLSNVLDGEEVFISCDNYAEKYINSVTPSTDFDTLVSADMVSL